MSATSCRGNWRSPASACGRASSRRWSTRRRACSPTRRARARSTRARTSSSMAPCRGSRGPDELMQSSTATATGPGRGVDAPQDVVEARVEHRWRSDYLAAENGEAADPMTARLGGRSVPSGVVAGMYATRTSRLRDVARSVPERHGCVAEFRHAQVTEPAGSPKPVERRGRLQPGGPLLDAETYRAATNAAGSSRTRPGRTPAARRHARPVATCPRAGPIAGRSGDGDAAWERAWSSPGTAQRGRARVREAVNAAAPAALAVGRRGAGAADRAPGRRAAGRIERDRGPDGRLRETPTPRRALRGRRTLARGADRAFTAWSYTPEQQHGRVEQPQRVAEGSFTDTVVRAADDGLITDEEYDAIVQALVEQNQRDG